MKKAIIIMAKVPEAGKVKTRLQSVLSAEKCAEFAECLLQDAINKAKILPTLLILAYSPSDKNRFFDLFLDHKIIFVPQEGTDLGERMFNAFQFAFEQNLDSIVMIGTDSPVFPARFIENAFDLLTESDAVLGRTDDGGYYLIGLRKLKKEIFENVEWSSPATFRQTAQNIENNELKLTLLPRSYDVDLPEDLEKLKADLNKNPKLAPITAKWLEENKKS